jgi:hypothetical protein
MNVPQELAGYRRRTGYPDDGTLVERIIRTEGEILYIVYEDNSYLPVKKVGR